MADTVSAITAPAITHTISTARSARGVTAYGSFARQKTGSPVPPRRVVTAMVAELARELAAIGARPVDVLCNAFFDGVSANIAAITLAVEPGDMPRSVASWFEWQHPRWVFVETPPAIEGAAAAVAS